MRRIPAYILILLCVTTVNAVSDVEQLPASIEAAVSGGYWKSGDKDGRYRVVVVNGGFEHVHSKVFLQWVTGPTSERVQSILLSVPVREINESNFWSVGVPEFVTKMREISLHATNSYTLEEATFVIKPGVAGKYEIRRIDRGPSRKK
jgi:hypothetical protein